MNNNHYHNKILENLTPAYKEWFDADRAYIANWVPGNSYVLDIGCGDGRVINDLLQVTNNIEAIDIDNDAVLVSRKRFAEIKTVNIQMGSVYNIPYEDNIFDVVTCIGTFMNFEVNKVQSALAEMKRVLKNHGSLIVSSFNEDAMSERINMYEKLDAVKMIKEIKGNTVVFDESFGANTSTQYSKSELDLFFSNAGFGIIECVKLSMAYIYLLKK